MTDITLPLLPETGFSHPVSFTASDMKKYASAAIEADRKARAARTMELAASYAVAQSVYDACDDDERCEIWRKKTEESRAALLAYVEGKC